MSWIRCMSQFWPVQEEGLKELGELVEQLGKLDEQLSESLEYSLELDELFFQLGESYELSPISVGFKCRRSNPS